VHRPGRDGCTLASGHPQLSDGEQQFLGAEDAGFTAGLALVVAGVGLDALSVGAAADADAGVLQASSGGLDRGVDAVFRADECALIPLMIIMGSGERISGEPGETLSSTAGLAHVPALLSLSDGAHQWAERPAGW